MNDNNQNFSNNQNPNMGGVPNMGQDPNLGQDYNQTSNQNQYPNMGNDSRHNPTQPNRENEKWICVIAYFIFFVPLLVDINNPRYKFHANQGLAIAIISIASRFLYLIPYVGKPASIIVGIGCSVLAIIGIINALNGKDTPLPIIGGIKLIK